MRLSDKTMLIDFSQLKLFYQYSNHSPLDRIPDNDQFLEQTIYGDRFLSSN